MMAAGVRSLQQRLTDCSTCTPSRRVDVEDRDHDQSNHAVQPAVDQPHTNQLSTYRKQARDHADDYRDIYDCRCRDPERSGKSNNAGPI